MIRTCNKCGAKVDNKKPDPCFGKYLPEIAFCCCGHGNNTYAYCVGWENCLPNEGPTDWREENDPTYWCLRGIEAIEYMENLK
ncbi:MAG TPA: hypothetical protein VI432_00115 [Candidatus Paceibacterota bacterium]